MSYKNIMIESVILSILFDRFLDLLYYYVESIIKKGEILCQHQK